MLSQTRRGAVFFDRDGVLNEDLGYVHRIEDFRWTPDAREAVRLVNQSGRLAIVATNQAGVARGFYGEEDVRRLHDWMRQDLAAVGARIDAFYYCPYHEAGVVERYAVADHPDRKPNPGMLLQALSAFDIDPSLSAIIGDRESDLEAGRRAGLGGVLYRGGSLAEVVRSVLAGGAGSP